MANTIESKNIEVGAWWSAEAAKEYIPQKPKIPEQSNEEEVNIDREAAYKNPEWSQVTHEDNHAGAWEKEAEAPLTFDQKKSMIEKFLTKNNIDPTKYPTEIKNLANLVGKLDEKTIMERIWSVNRIADLSNQKWWRGKIFSRFGLEKDKIA